jgi:hypothetical protein
MKEELEAHITDITKAYSILVGKLKRKRKFVRSTSRWEDNIEMGVK